jgi:uncharacterized phage infection (PIP) family protein YhgE
MPYELILDPEKITHHLVAGYEILRHPVIQDLLKQAMDGATKEAGKQVLLIGAKTVQKQLQRAINALKAMFGNASPAIQQLEGLQAHPEEFELQQKLIYSLTQEIAELKKSSSGLVGLESALEEIQSLHQETKNLASQLQVSLTQSHSGSGHNISATGGGDAFGGDKNIHHHHYVEKKKNL